MIVVGDIDLNVKIESNEATSATLTIPEGAAVQGNPSYDPDPLTVSAGDFVEVTNQDTFPHTVTRGSGPEAPESGSQFDTSIIDARATAQLDTANLAAGDYSVLLFGAPVYGRNYESILKISFLK